MMKQYSKQKTRVEIHLCGIHSSALRLEILKATTGRAWQERTRVERRLAQRVVLGGGINMCKKKSVLDWKQNHQMINSKVKKIIQYYCGDRVTYGCISHSIIGPIKPINIQKRGLSWENANARQKNRARQWKNNRNAITTMHIRGCWLEK